jgi:hypothetical protein
MAYPTYKTTYNKEFDTTTISTNWNSHWDGYIPSITTFANCSFSIPEEKDDEVNDEKCHLCLTGEKTRQTVEWVLRDDGEVRDWVKHTTKTYECGTVVVDMDEDFWLPWDEPVPPSVKVGKNCIKFESE